MIWFVRFEFFVCLNLFAGLITCLVVVLVCLLVVVLLICLSFCFWLSLGCFDFPMCLQILIWLIFGVFPGVNWCVRFIDRWFGCWLFIIDWWLLTWLVGFLVFAYFGLICVLVFLGFRLFVYCYCLFWLLAAFGLDGVLVRLIVCVLLVLLVLVTSVCIFCLWCVGCLVCLGWFWDRCLMIV